MRIGGALPALTWQWAVASVSRDEEQRRANRKNDAIQAASVDSWRTGIDHETSSYSPTSSAEGSTLNGSRTGMLRRQRRQLRTTSTWRRAKRFELLANEIGASQNWRNE